MSAPLFDVARLRTYATAQSIQRGRDYFQEGAVEALVRRGDELEADVQGSALRPYRVRIVFEEQGAVRASCTCPYEYGGWCKHIVAALLAYAKQPENADSRPPLAEMLELLDRGQLRALLLELADQIPRLSDQIETALSVIRLPATPNGAASVVVDTRALRRGVRNAIQAGNNWDEEYDEDGYGVIGDIVELAEQARPALETGDGRAALAILEAVTDELSKHWEILDESGGEASSFFDHTLSLWSEALLDPSLSAGERQHWALRLADWTEDFDESVAGALQLLQTVVRQGWDDPALCAVLRGEEAPAGLWGADLLSYHQRVSITQARLRILERTGQHEAYLHLAKAEQQYDDYALKLLQQDRVREALTAGLEQPLSDQGILELAKALYAHSEIEAAFQVAEHGLCRPAATAPNEQEWPWSVEQTAGFGWRGCDAHSKSELAVWLRDRAAEHGQRERALAAGETAFRIAPSLAAYQKLEALAGADWPDLQQSLLDFLGQEQYIGAEIKVEIFLYERRIDDAISAVTQHYASAQTLAQVMDAAIPLRPEWVVAQGRRLAEAIMDGAKSSHYEEAAQWLRKVRQAFATLDQQPLWQVYLDILCEKHRRKYRLIPLLKAL